MSRTKQPLVRVSIPWNTSLGTFQTITVCKVFHPSPTKLHAWHMFRLVMDIFSILQVNLIMFKYVIVNLQVAENKVLLSKITFKLAKV